MRTKIPNQKEKMLTAAVQLFGGQNYHEVRMEDVAAAADVGKGTLYRYFHDKDDLYFALLARSARQMQERLAQAIALNGTIRQKLVAFIASGFEFFDSQPQLASLIQRAELLHGADSPWHTTRATIYMTTLELFRQAAAAEEFIIREPELAVHLLWGGTRSILLFSPQPRPEGLAEAIVANFLGGAADKPAGPVASAPDFPA